MEAGALKILEINPLLLKSFIVDNSEKFNLIYPTDIWKKKFYIVE